MAFPTQSLNLVAASSQYASITDNVSLSITGDFTIEAWVKAASQPSNTYVTIFSKDTNTGNQRGYWFRYGDTAGVKNFLLGVSSNGSGRTNVTVNASLTTGTWTHVAAVYTASLGKFELFINGVSQGSATGLPTSVFNNTADAQVGALLDTGSEIQFWDGNIGLMRVWKATRVASDFTTNYCTELGVTTNLQAEWTFDNVYTDNSGNANTLTSHGTPVFQTDVTSTCNVAPFWQVVYK